MKLGLKDASVIKADDECYGLTAALTQLNNYGHSTWFDMDEFGVWYVAAVRHHNGRKGWRHFVINHLLRLAVAIGKPRPEEQRFVR